MGKNSMQKEKRRQYEKLLKKMKRAKDLALEIPLCPKCGIKFTVESSKDLIHEGAWRHFYCQKCREETK